MKKLNKRTFDINLKNIRNNRHEYNKHTISLRPTYVSDLKNERSSLKPNINKLTLNISEQNKEINNNANRYNIFVNYKSRGNNNYDKNYYKRNNYYFNNCNFINNNINYNNYHNKNNNLLNPYNNNNYYYNNYNQFYQDFINHLSLKKLKEEKNTNIKYNNDINNQNTNEKPYIINSDKLKIDENNENNRRKVIYEKINFNKKGNKYEYSRGPTQIRYVGNGNYYNKCHKAIINNPVIINPAKQFGIQNLIISGGKQNRNGPRIILPKNMFV